MVSTRSAPALVIRLATSLAEIGVLVAKDITKQRLYLETMEEVFRGMNKVIIDSSASGASGVVPYLPLPEIRIRSRGEPRSDDGE